MLVVTELELLSYIGTRLCDLAYLYEFELVLTRPFPRHHNQLPWSSSSKVINYPLPLAPPLECV